MDIDHVVLWVEDAKQSLDFYQTVMGLEPVREEEFLAGKARFPSVRLNEQTIFDLMDRNELLQRVQDFTGGGAGIGGTPINHVCLSMTRDEHSAIAHRLELNGIALTSGGENAFGAQGHATRSDYFNDPDGNVIEIRYYDQQPWPNSHD